MIYLYHFRDNDEDYDYNIITNEDCTNLIEDIEDFYYDFEEFSNIPQLIRFLNENNADRRLIDYVLKQNDIEDLTISGICGLTKNILEELDVMVEYELHTIIY